MKSLVIALAISLLPFAVAIGQTGTVHTTGLTTPNKIINAPDNSLIVAEAGATAPNTGRLSIVDRTSGARHTLVSGLPSALNFLGGNPAGDPSGPSGLNLRGNRLLITIGSGDSVLPGAGPGLEVPNPTPSSPIFSSVLELTLPGGFATLDSPFVMTSAHQATIDGGDPVTLTNTEGVSLTVRLVVDFPNSRPAPTPTVPTNVKASNPYGIDTFQKSAYVADAGHNEIKIVNLSTGDWAVFTTFPNRPNPTPVGGPFIEAVPTNIHRIGNRMLVTLLTGFPFVPNLAEVRRVSLKVPGHEQFIGGLTSAMDILHIGDDKESAVEARGVAGKSIFVQEESRVTPQVIDPGDGSAFYTLEFSTNMLMGAPGRLRFYETPDAAPVNLLSNLITPTSMTRDDDTGNLYITNIGPGTITKVTFP